MIAPSSRRPNPSAMHLQNHFDTLQSSLFNASTAITRLTGLIGEQRTRLQAIMATLPEGMLMMDGEGRVLLENGLASTFLEEMALRVSEPVHDLPSKLCRRLKTQGLSCLTHEVPAKDKVYRLTLKRFHPESPVERYALYIRKETATPVATTSRQRNLESFMLDLVAALAHEINNPLTPILALSSPGMRMGDESDDTLETIFTSGERIAGLVGQMLTLEAVMRSDTTQPVNLNVLCEELVAERQGQASPSTFSVYCAQDEPVSRLGESAIRQLIRFLLISLDNARSRMPHGVELRIDEAEAGWLFQIRDAGFWAEDGGEDLAPQDGFVDYYALLAETLAGHMRVKLSTLRSRDGKTGYALWLPKAQAAA